MTMQNLERPAKCACQRCRGYGWVKREDPCSRCQGSGVEPPQERPTVGQGALK